MLGPGCVNILLKCRETGLKHEQVSFTLEHMQQLFRKPAKVSSQFIGMILTVITTGGLYLPLSESHHSCLEEVQLGKPLLARLSWKGSEVLQ